MVHQLQRGFTLIELAIVIAILSGLAYFAVPSYHDYLIASQVREAIQVAHGWQESIAMYHRKKGVWPTMSDLENSLVVVTNLSDRYTRRYALLGNGVIEITFDDQHVDSHLSGRKLELQPYVGPAGDVIWHCDDQGSAEDHVQARFRSAPCLSREF